MKTQDIKNMGHAYLSVLEAIKNKLDLVDKDELKGDHKDRKDKDIDNDGDADKSDAYLHNRRKTISKASKGKEVETTESVEEAKRVITAKQIKNALASAKAQAKPKDQVSLKKAPFDIPKESFDVDSLLAIFEKLEESQIDLILANLDKQQLDEISMTKMTAYASKAVKSKNDAMSATYSADSKRKDNAQKTIAKRKAGADNYNKKMWGYANVAPTKESVKTESKTWTIFNRIMEKATHAGNSDKEKADQGASGKDKEFIKMMGGLDGQDSGIDGAKAAQQTIDSIRASGKVAAKRPGDQDVGDKKIVK